MSSTLCFNLDQSKIWSSGNGLIATFQFLSAASLNVGRSQNGILENGYDFHISAYPIHLKTLAISLVNKLLDNPCLTSLFHAIASSRFWSKYTGHLHIDVRQTEHLDTILPFSNNKKISISSLHTLPCFCTEIRDLSLYSSTIPSRILRFSTFKSNTTSDWLQHMVLPMRSCITFKCRKSWEIRPRMFLSVDG